MSNIIRKWAEATGYQIGERGRIPKTVVIDYLITHPAEARQYCEAHNVTVGKRGRVAVSAIVEAVKG